MTVDEVKRQLTSAGYRVVKEERLPNETGSQLRLDGGAIVNVFDNGTVNCQASMFSHAALMSVMRRAQHRLGYDFNYLIVWLRSRKTKLHNLVASIVLCKRSSVV